VNWFARSVGPCLQVRSEEMEKSRMYLKRTRVAMQALLHVTCASAYLYVQPC
jgi:hypothetical protein